MEALVLVLICLAPWPYGAVEPHFEFVLLAGVAVLLVLWGARILLEGRVAWAKCPVTLCLGALVFTAFAQLIPLPETVLGWLSPGTARMYGRLLPERPEVLAAGEGAPDAESTVSLYPGETRRQLVRLLAVLLLFVVVRNNIASKASLRRLAMAATVNGAALSLFGLIQYFSSSPDTVYWSYVSAGSVFGPFVCRNHFAFYINLCFGLGVGLFLDARESGPTPTREGFALTPGILQDPRSLWLIIALTLMLTGVAFTLSRGGILALLGGSIICLAMWLVGMRRLPRAGAAFLVLLLAVALGTWLGLDQVRARLATVEEGKALRESRLPLWSRTLTLATDFPLWGTGLGTFVYVEPMRRTGEEELFYTNAENEYLEAFLEGGVVRLALSLLAVALIFRYGWRAFRRLRGRPGAGLALGALLSFTIMAVENFGDFALHIPAIAFFATILCAQLCALGGPTPSVIAGRPARSSEDAGKLMQTATSRLEPRPSPVSRRLGGIVAAATFALLALFLFREGFRAVRVSQLREESFRLNRSSDPAERGRRFQCLEEAVRWDPDSARLQVDLGLAHLDAYRDGNRQLLRKASRWEAVPAAGALAHAGWPGSASVPAQVVTPLWSLATQVGMRPVEVQRQRLTEEHLVPALRHFLRARALCPLLPESHRCLADHVGKLTQGDTRAAYLERAKLLMPYDPVLWFLCGQEYLRGQPARAWENWRRCLEISDLCLEPILEVAAQKLNPQEMLDRVLPANARLLLRAAHELYPGRAGGLRRRVILKGALALLAAKSETFGARDYHLKAILHQKLGEPEPALAAFRSALARDPAQADWRFEFAVLLRRQGQLKEARRELAEVVRSQPNNREAQNLLGVVVREMAMKGWPPSQSP
jgi:O-antigen ligase/tetratricopeptide (TPR) repeat protein